MSQLLPDGITSFRDVPYPLHRAIKSGLVFLSFEELPEEDQPPRSMWLDGKALKQHFVEVRRRNREKFGGNKDIEDPVSNAAIDMLIVGDR